MIFGTIDLDDTLRTNRNIQISGVKRLVYKDYKFPKNDIALLKVSSEKKVYFHINLKLLTLKFNLSMKVIHSQYINFDYPSKKSICSLFKNLKKYAKKNLIFCYDLFGYIAVKKNFTTSFKALLLQNVLMRKISFNKKL